MSTDRSNTASETFAAHVAALNDGAPPEGLVQSWLADDFTYEDRRRGPTFPDGDAESYPRLLETAWETGAAGQPRFQHAILAVRGERFAAAALTVDYGNGMLFESVHVLALDAGLNLAQRVVDFDVEDVDGAIAELDRLHSQADVS